MTRVWGFLLESHFTHPFSPEVNRNVVPLGRAHFHYFD